MTRERRGPVSAWIVGAVGMTLAVSVFVTACSETARYSVLTFFFEGVPPPPSQRPKGGGGEVQPPQPPPVSFHRAFRSDHCTECHIGRTELLTQPVPILCLRCHPRNARSEPWNHAPARVGDCLACHVGHEAMTHFLLVREGKSLCYGCHRESFIVELEGHRGIDLADCVNCHQAHEGGTKPAAKSGVPASPKNAGASSQGGGGPAVAPIFSFAGSSGEKQFTAGVPSDRQDRD